MSSDTTPLGTAERPDAAAGSTHVDVGPLLDNGPLGGYQRFVISLTALAVILDGVDSQLLGIAIPSIMAEWGVERESFSPVLAAGFIGMMVGGAVAGVAGDRLGRRVALIGSVLLFGVMTLGASLAPGLLALGILRFFVGIGLQGASPNAAAMVSEYAPSRFRAFAITATIVCIPLGATLAGLLAIPLLPSLGWRGLFAVGGLLSVVAVVGLLKFLPESPRFLARRPARWPELARLLGRIGHRVAPDASFADHAERAVERAPMKALFGTGSLFDTLALWSAFFFCLLAVYSGFNWIPSLLSSAGFGSSVASTGITAYNLGGVAGAISGGLAIKRYGSRLTMLSMSAAAGGIALAMTLLTLSPDAPVIPIIVMLALIGGLINAVQVTMYALAAHVYPTMVRATGVGVATSVGRLGAILSTYAGAYAIERGGHISFFTLVAIAMVAVFISLALIRQHIPGIRAASATPVSSPA